MTFYVYSKFVSQPIIYSVNQPKPKEQYTNTSKIDRTTKYLFSKGDDLNLNLIKKNLILTS